MDGVNSAKALFKFFLIFTLNLQLLWDKINLPKFIKELLLCRYLKK